MRARANMFLDAEEKFSFRTTKVAHNALISGRYPRDHRPIWSDLAPGWPKQVAERVMAKWITYGYKTPSKGGVSL